MINVVHGYYEKDLNDLQAKSDRGWVNSSDHNLKKLEEAAKNQPDLRDRLNKLNIRPDGG